MQTLPSWIRSEPAGVRLALRVQPGARRSALIAQHGERPRVAVQAPPVEGRANEALLRYLAQRLDLRTGSLRLVAGANSRDKSVLIECDPSRAGLIAQRLLDGLSR
jgi:uncharacterized protein